MLASPSVAAAAVVSVDATPPVRALGPTFHGINHVGFWDPAQGSDASADALANTPVSLVRFPGGAPGDGYDWRPNDLWRYAEKLSAVPLYQTDFQDNPTEHAAAWASWAADTGVPALFEIGNEKDLQLGAYIDAFIDQRAAIHAGAPGTVVMGPAATHEYDGWGLHSLGLFLEQVGDVTGTGEIDALSIHFYSGTTWDDTRGVAQAWQSSDGPWAFVQETIAAHSTVELPVYITEWHLGDAATVFDASMASALVTADLIGAFAASGVAGHAFFYEGDRVAGDTPTPAFYAYALWSAMGRDVLATTSDADAATELSVWATSDEGGVQVMAINKTDAVQPLSIAIDGFATAGQPVVVHTLAPVGGRDAFDVTWNGTTNPDPVASPPAGVTDEAEDGGYTTEVPANAIVVVQIGQAPDSGDDGDPTDGPEPGESSGSGSGPSSSAGDGSTPIASHGGSNGGEAGEAGGETDPAGCGCSPRRRSTIPALLVLVLAGLWRTRRRASDC